MKIKSYSEINQSSTSGINSFRKNLAAHYKDKPLELSVSNAQNNYFLIFNNPIIELEKEFEKLTTQALERRNVNMSEYLTSGYITSEINSSLRAEGVNSSRKYVDQVLKQKKNGEKLGNDELTKLISNYYDALFFILGNKKINERNLFTLYSILSSDLPDIIEENSFYRKGAVSIGQDLGMAHNTLSNKMQEIITFINSNYLEERIQTKAIICHYIFENIHPYYDYNGRMGRLIHLWILINKSMNEFWKLIYISEAIYAYKTKLDTAFRKITKAKKNEANIDLTFFVGNMYEIFLNHTKAYIKMKNLVATMKTRPTRHLRLFIIDLLCSAGEFNMWYQISEFKNRYTDYSKTVYDRTLKEIKNSGLFEIREGKPIMFRLKKNVN